MAKKLYAGVRPGIQIGRYLIDRRIATGGMAEVWLGKAMGMAGFSRDVCIKTVLSPYNDQPEFINMFTREALLAAQLHHPNIVQIFDFGESPYGFYIAMEYIHGKTLREMLAEANRVKARLPEWFVTYVGIAACDALHYAHKMKDDGGNTIELIHRDVSPENIMVSASGEVKLLDFGTARTSNDLETTKIGVLKGKYRYMAPLLIGGEEKLGSKTDIYSLGSVLYEMLSSERPYNAHTGFSLLTRMLDESCAPNLREKAPWVSPGLIPIVSKAMARNPNDRYGSAASLQADLESFSGSHGYQVTRKQAALYLATLFPQNGAQANYQARENRSVKPTNSPVSATNSLPEAPSNGSNGSFNDKYQNDLTPVEIILNPQDFEAQAALPTEDPSSKSAQVVGELQSLSAPKLGGTPSMAAAETQSSPSQGVYGSSPELSIANVERLLQMLRESSSPGTTASESSASYSPESAENRSPEYARVSVVSEKSSGKGNSNSKNENALPDRAKETKVNVDLAGMVLIPTCSFSSRFSQEEIILPAFYVDRHLVTNADFNRFVTETSGEPPDHWLGRAPSRDTLRHPVVGVTYESALAFARWSHKRLLGPWEWERLATRAGANNFPWGDELEPSFFNGPDMGIGGTSEIGAFPAGASPEGCFDLIGNVWEWSNLEGPGPRPELPEDAWAFGGSFRHRVRTGRLNRTDVQTTNSYLYLGFRCAMTVS